MLFANTNIQNLPSTGQNPRLNHFIIYCLVVSLEAPYGLACSRASPNCSCVNLTLPSLFLNITTSHISSHTILPRTAPRTSRSLNLHHSSTTTTRPSLPARRQPQFTILANLTRPLTCGCTVSSALSTGSGHLRVRGVILKLAQVV